MAESADGGAVLEDHGARSGDVPLGGDFPCPLPCSSLRDAGSCHLQSRACLPRQRLYLRSGGGLPRGHAAPRLDSRCAGSILRFLKVPVILWHQLLGLKMLLDCARLGGVLAELGDQYRYFRSERDAWYFVPFCVPRNMCFLRYI
jgi:hypothetical protein